MVLIKTSFLIYLKFSLKKSSFENSNDNTDIELLFYSLVTKRLQQPQPAC